MGLIQRLIGNLSEVVDSRKWACSIVQDVEEDEDGNLRRNTLPDQFERLQKESEQERRLLRENGEASDHLRNVSDENCVAAVASGNDTSNGIVPNNGSDNNGKDDLDHVNDVWPPPPFMRNDEYGVCGCHGPRLTILQYARVIIRGFSAVLIISTFAVCLIVSTVLLRSPQKANKYWSKRLPVWTKFLMYTVGFEPLTIHLVNQDVDGNILSVTTTDSMKTPFLQASAPVLVCNHISYLDVPILCWVLFPSLIAKESVKKLPIWGRLAEVMQCTFVSHGSTNAVKTAASDSASSSSTNQLIARIHHNAKLRGTASQLPPMVVFPEATTTNGSCLLPFKTGVFAAETKVQPVLLEYHWERFNVSWESIGLLRHMVYLLAQSSHHCTMTILNPIDPPTPEETKLVLRQQEASTMKGGAMDWNDAALRQRLIAKNFASKTRHIMSKIGNLPYSGMTYKEKEKYHNELRATGYS